MHPLISRLALCCAAIVVLWQGLVNYHIDLDVYRIGARVLLRGGDLYGPMPPTTEGFALPFTYPPFAAALFVPLALVPFPVAATMLSLVTVVMLGYVLHLFRMPWQLLPLVLFAEPVSSTLGYGQVNVLLMALVAADCLVPHPRWPRGLLVGVAAAIKLTPLVFLLFFLLRKDFRAAVTACLGFAAVAALGFLVSWRDSLRYWTEILFDAGRVGGNAYVSNQSLHGVLARLELGNAWWIGLCLVVLVLAVFAMRRASTRQALVINALAGLLVSPVSWSHHWVWLIPAVLLLAERSKWLVLACAPVLAGGLWLVPNSADRELHWSFGEHLLGDSYALFGLVLLAAAALVRRRAVVSSAAV